MTSLAVIDFSLPITNPTWIFFIVMVIILLVPILFGKLRIPHIIGMILAGIIIGQFGFNILERDSSFELFGQVGLYYIMFLAGLEMDMEGFRKNSVKGLVFGLITFIVPMTLGILSGIYMLHYGVVTAVLLASMYASHTLVSYPIVSRYGLAQERSVTITIGGTAVTVTLALLVLAAVSGMFQGTVSTRFWLMLALKVTLIILAIVFVLPKVGRWFFRKYNDAVLQFVFVLAMVFLGGGLMSLAGLEGILGAFLVGMAINPLIPKVSPLMNRIEFVGNAIFIPYFLIGVGMIIDVRALVASGEALKVAAVMTVVATVSKWLAAFVTQKIYGMNRTERMMIFGLSNAQAAATLAAVLIGHDIIMENGERLLSDEVLNGTIVMILFTCVISAVVTERAAKRFALGVDSTAAVEEGPEEEPEKLLIPVANPETIENLVNLALVVKSPTRRDGIVALNVINDSGASQKLDSGGRRSLETAAKIASAAGVKVEMVSRYDMNITSGIIHTIREYEATTLVIGLHRKGSFLDSFFGSLTGNLLKGTNREVIVARLMMPVNTMKGIVAIVPPRAEFETGFGKCITHLCRIATGLGCRIRFRAEAGTAEVIGQIVKSVNAEARADVVVAGAQNFAELMVTDLAREQLLAVVNARSGTVSYDSAFERLPSILNRHYQDANLLVVYPEQIDQRDSVSFSDPIGAE